MVKKEYVPDRGDIVWLNFTPQAGKEQSGKRPALILSPKLYNEAVGLALACPITNQIKDYPFEVALPKKFTITGVVLIDHVKSIDWNARNVRYIESVSARIMDKVFGKLRTLL
jgi:mRNA interferase MazF